MSKTDAQEKGRERERKMTKTMKPSSNKVGDAQAEEMRKKTKVDNDDEEAEKDEDLKGLHTSDS